ncbi:MAG: chemotaxis protein CheW [Chloroflexi bacterium]|nr:chemotaxis protein CheW [Chloroflexota bacterium]
MAMAVDAAQEEKQLVVFDLDSESYGVDIGAVREIIRMQDITRVPRAPDFVEGVINLRGKVIPVVDLRKKFGLPVPEEQSKDNRIVVVDIGGQDIGVMVDAVTEVLRIATDSIAPPSSVITGADSEYLLGIVKLESGLIILLDLEKVLSEEERATLLDGSPDAATQAGELSESKVAG